MSPRHIEMAGSTPKAFWNAVDVALANAAPAACEGEQHWAVLQFRRGGPRWEATKGRPPIVDIGWSGSAEG